MYKFCGYSFIYVTVKNSICLRLSSKSMPTYLDKQEIKRD